MLFSYFDKSMSARDRQPRENGLCFATNVVLSVLPLPNMVSVHFLKTYCQILKIYHFEWSEKPFLD